MYNNMNQLYAYIRPLPLEAPSHPSDNPSHPSGSSQSTELSSLRYTASESSWWKGRENFRRKHLVKGWRLEEWLPTRGWEREEVCSGTERYRSVQLNGRGNFWGGKKIHGKGCYEMHDIISISIDCVSHSVLSDSCNCMDCSPPGSSVHGILQAKVLEWVAISSSRGSSQPRDRTRDSYIAGRLLTI